MDWVGMVKVLQSKKFQTLLTTIVCATIAKLGADVDNEIVGYIIALGSMAIGGFAAQDVAEAKARVALKEEAKQSPTHPVQ